MEKYNTTKGLLLQVELPKETNTYKVYSHRQVIDTTLEAIEKSGFQLASETYSSTSDGQVAIGKYAIRNVADNEMQLQIGWINSYNKTKKLGWALGSRIIVCENGMVSGDLGAFKKKHQGEINEFAPRTIIENVKNAGEIFQNMQKERELMKQVEVDKLAMAHILGELFITEEIIQSTQMGIIKREIEMPSFDYGVENSLWNMYQNVTLSLKELHPSLYMKSHIDAHNYFTKKIESLDSLQLA